jgi:D-aspartate ligase
VLEFLASSLKERSRYSTKSASKEGESCARSSVLASSHNRGLLTLNSSGRPTVLLATASSGGTIAAARNLAANGFRVGVISNARAPLPAAAWSRRVACSYSAPAENDSRRFLQRLLAIGAAEPGQILLPTSDETAWLYTENAAVLEQHFCVYQPSIATLRRILDKKLLADAAISANVAVLPSWEPRTTEEVVALAPSLPYPILIKPRTHVHRVRNDKGVVVHSMAELIREYPRVIDREGMRTSDNALLPDAALPILQQFVSVAKHGVCSITGFMDRSRQLFVTRRSNKVLQRSQYVGVGVCFESLPADAMLSDAVRRLCLELDYFGIFEVEFLKVNDRWAVIDFNPRLYNQLGMDIRRGMPLPLLACLDAAGDTTSLRSAVAAAQSEAEGTFTVFYDAFILRAILMSRILTGRMSRKEFAYWRAWTKQNGPHAVDAAKDDSDSMPAAIHALSEMYIGLKAIPRFLFKTPRASFAVARGSIESRS